MALFSSCATTKRRPNTQLVISATDQKMIVLEKGTAVKEYPISTSKFGVGDQRGSYQTPLGKMRVARKIGGGLPSGAVLKSRRPTGEVLAVNAPGRDPIVTRIIWLSGTERQNVNAFNRFIYIHGTPEERNIGSPASYGCIRMRSDDIIDLYNRLPVGSDVYVTTKSLSTPTSGHASGHNRSSTSSRYGSTVSTERASRNIVKQADARVAAELLGPLASATVESEEETPLLSANLESVNRAALLASGPLKIFGMMIPKKAKPVTASVDVSDVLSQAVRGTSAS